ncbi:MAG: NUDIX domain-containing protein [Thalassovita sp.]
MTGVFLYGTLRHLPLLEMVLGRAVAQADLIPAVFGHHKAVWAKGQGFPLIVTEVGAQADGILFANATDHDLEMLDFYEGGFGYQRGPVTVMTEAGDTVETTIWWPPTEGVTPGEPFDLADWVDTWGAINTRAALEIMGYRGQYSAQKVASMFGMIQSRAACWVRAQSEQQPKMKSGLARKDVRTQQLKRPYANYFAMEEQLLEFRRFDGAFSETLDRGVFLTPDVAMVLPYDPKRDRVLMVEQFRMGPWVRGDVEPWQYECVAGRVDPGETPEHCARREAEEEAGLKLDELIEVHQGYASPGATTEYYYAYLALMDLPDSLAQVGGLESEAEDIRSHLVGFDDLMTMLDCGQLRVTPLAMSVLWLARNRNRLRAGA